MSIASHSSAGALGLALCAALASCSSGPQPRDLSNAPQYPLSNTAAQVENEHAITEIVDSPDALAVLAQLDRTAEDRAFDDPRQAADVLTYLAVTPGMRVAELGSGGGYFTELLGRSVGRSGVVYAQNPQSLLARAPFAGAWTERLARPANARVVRDAREFSAPFPAEARGLDLVYLALFYRDLPSVGVDRRLMLANVLDALRPGGRLVTIDRATPRLGQARVDPRVSHVEESRNERYEVERAGFHFVSEARFLRRSATPTDWDAVANDRPTPLETQDRFLLTFVK
jgi:predicted methyltransferase